VGIFAVVGAVAVSITFGRNARACNSSCPGGWEQVITSDFYWVQNGNQGFWAAPNWATFNTWQLVGNDMAWVETGYSKSSGYGYFFLTPNGNPDFLCIDAAGWQAGAEVPNCAAECNSGNFGGSKCTASGSLTCLNPQNGGYGPPDEFAYDVYSCVQ